MIEPCTCGALCYNSSSDCRGRVKIVGLKDHDWVHSCKVHHHEAVADHYIEPLDWESPGPS